MTTLTAFVLAVSAAAPVAPAAPGDLARLQGRWTARAGAQGEIPVVLEIRGSRAFVRFTTRQGLAVQADGAVRLDESSRPKALDWVEFTAPDGQDLPPILAIYELDGDTLRVCNSGFNNDRPVEFRPGEGILASVVVFRRPAPAPGNSMASGDRSR